MQSILFLIIGLFVGFFLCFFLLNPLRNRAETRAKVLEATQEQLQQSHREALDAQEKRFQESLQAQKTQFEESVKLMGEQMKNATGEMLKERQKEFSESSQTQLGHLVNPLKEAMENMRKTMDSNTQQQHSLSGEMKAHVDNMMRQSQAAQKSADELAKAFKHGSKVQGDWGEILLDEILQSQGLTRGIHYDIQATLRDENGRVIQNESNNRMRPDVILHLDSQRDVIIDSKVSLTAFVDYVNAENEADRQASLKAHIDSLWSHVKELSKKDYSAYIRPPKIRMDYVIMFVPHSGALWTALNQQPDLWRKAMEMNVFIADEQTLYAAVRIIQLTWSQIQQAQNHEKVYQLADEMLSRVGQLWEDFLSADKALEAARKAHESLGQRISEGGRSINTTAHQLVKLGAHANAKHPLPADDSVTGGEL